MKDIWASGIDLNWVADWLARGGNVKEANRELVMTEQSYGLSKELGKRFGAGAEADMKQALKTVRKMLDDDTPAHRAKAVSLLRRCASRVK